jgi:hypothetical protein
MVKENTGRIFGGIRIYLQSLNKKTETEKITS